MLDLMRKHAGTWLIKVVLGAIIIVFAFWGVGSYNQERVTRVAVVNGNTINVDQYRESYNRILEQLRQRFGNNLNDEMIKMFNVRQQAVDSLIDQTLLVGEAKRLQFRVTDEELSTFIRNVTSFQSNGRFDPQFYRRVLTANRMTPESFEASQRDSMLIGKLRSMVTGSVKVSEAEARQWYDWDNASVDIEYVFFDPKRDKDIQPASEEIEAFYNEKKASYKTEPLIKARYIQFDRKKYEDKVNVSQDEIREYHAAHPREYENPKTVEARHILIKIGAKDSAETVEAARKKALDILKKVRDGADFAETAKQYSEGPSKDNGGFLGAFRKEAMVAPFSEKAFAMAAGEVSEPVRTQFGWHIIKVEKVNPASTVSLEEAEPSIRKKLVDEQVKILAYDTAEAVYDTTFDESDLSKIAAEQGLELQTTDAFTKKGPEKGMKNPAAFARAAFELKVDEVSEVQDIDGDYYIIQVVEETPEKIADLNTVADRVKADLVEKKQDEKAKKDATAFLTAVKGGQAMAEAGKSFNVVPASTGWFKRKDAIPEIGFEPAIAEAVFKLSNDMLFPEDVIQGKKGYYITRFKERKLPDDEGFVKEKETVEQRLLRQKELEAFNALLAEIKQRSEITISEAYREP